jgi:hypothetical protein
MSQSWKKRKKAGRKERMGRERTGRGKKNTGGGKNKQWWSRKMNNGRGKRDSWREKKRGVARNIYGGGGKYIYRGRGGGEGGKR